MKKRLFVLALGLFSCGGLGIANAAMITDLYNTGVDNSGAVLGYAVADPHYSLISQPNSGGLVAKTLSNDGYPLNPWVANNTSSKWIGPNTNYAEGPVGGYTYRTTFTLPDNAELGTVKITGSWGTDDPGDLYLNGSDIGLNTPNFYYLTTLSISAGFNKGLNILDFLVYNAGGPTGLRVDNLVGTYDTAPVPEPATIMLLGTGLAGLIGAQRKKKA